MAYTYNPYEYEAGVGRPFYDSNEGEWLTPTHGQSSQTGPQWDIAEANRQRSQFQDYAGEQFKGLFDMVNVPQKNPLEGFSNAPMYSPYKGTRDDFTSPVVHGTYYNWDEDISYPTKTGGDFDSKGYWDARFGNITDYLGQLGSFLGNMSGASGTPTGISQAEIQRATNRANMPTIGMSQPMGTPQMGSNPALSGFGGGGGRLVGKGWGTHPAFKGLLAGGGE